MTKRNSQGTLMRPDVVGDWVSNPVVTPIWPAAVYASPGPDVLDDQYAGRAEGYTYAREGHPNADLLAARIDRMEGLPEGSGIICGSGMAAVSAVFLGLLKAGDHVLGGDQLYGRSLRLMTQDLPRMGIACSLADSTDIDAMRAAIRPETRIILVEVVSNPTIRIADMVAIAELARETGTLLMVDSTFTTPSLWQAVEKGADIVVHSVTKLLAGHADVTLGYVAAKDPEIRRAINDAVMTFGMTPAPQDCWLAERGLLTFDLRFQQAQTTAAALADLLGAHPMVSQIRYPAHPDHPDLARATALLGGQGGNMLTFVLNGGRDEASRLVANLPGVAFAPTLGDAGTTLSHPCSSSHRALPPEACAAIGISEGMLRVSVGIEQTDALCGAFRNALDRL